MHLFCLSLSFSIIATHSLFALDNINNYSDNFFSDEIDFYNTDDNIFQDPLITLDDSNLSFDLIFSSLNADADVDESNINLFASCPPPENQLGARDEEPQHKEAKRNNFCSTEQNNLPATPPTPHLQLPTLDQLPNEMSGYDQTEKSLPLPGFSAAIVVKPGDIRAKNGNICPPYRPFYLCCICDTSAPSSACLDCLPSQFPIFSAFPILSHAVSSSYRDAFFFFFFCSCPLPPLPPSPLFLFCDGVKFD